jgi:hypothetical protein
VRDATGKFVLNPNSKYPVIPGCCARCGGKKAPQAKYCMGCRTARAIESATVRFWSKVPNRTPGQCWNFTGFCGKGYGQFSVSKVPIRAHRFSWELEHGPIPDSLRVLHSCDNPSCVNPEHLFLGTDKDNQHDAIKKGRHTCQKQHFGISVQA